MKIPSPKILVGALAILLVAACGASGSEDKADPASSAGSQVDDGGAPAEGLSDRDSTLSAPEQASAETGSRFNSDYSVADETGTQPQADPPTKTPPATEAIISKGQVSLRSKDLDETRFELQKLLDGWNGTIANEQSSADKKGNTDLQRLELRVPSKHFDTAMNELSELGTLVKRSRTSEDVSTQVIDNKTRVRSQKLSLARVQQLLARASTLNQVIMIEAQLSQRQADLESLEQQQKFLADQTAMSTIHLYLEVPGKKSGDKNADDGFFSGLKAGWDHLGSSTTAVLTGIGAVLPFAVVIALIGFPLWTAWRRRVQAVAPSEA